MDRRRWINQFLRRGIRNKDMTVMSIVFFTMVLMSLVIRDLNYVDVFILNLVHSIDTFMVVSDWRKGGMNMYFGMMYTIAACDLSLDLVIPSVSCIVISWIATFYNFGYPPLSWVFFPCLTMWGLKFIHKCAPYTVVVIAMLKTELSFLDRTKSLDDCLLICSLIAMHISFALENYFHYLLVSYLLSFVWMGLKSPLRRDIHHILLNCASYV